MDRALTFVRDLHDGYTTYHGHKESMAFTGLTLFTGATGAVLVGEKWPPNTWGNHGPLWALAAITVFWLGVLMYLRFQLRRRRWAALRVAGCERVLAAWITSTPTYAEIAPKVRDNVEISCVTQCIDFFWPQQGAVLAIKPTSKDNPAIYPSALVDAWVSQEIRGTDALMHEQLIVFSGWLMYVVLALYSLRTWL